jgi:small ligand-binding sensory domain FIST
MTPFKFAHSDAEGWAGIARELVDGLLSGDDLTHDEGKSLLGFLYVTDVISEDMGSILTYLRQTTGIDDWVGTTGIGICSTGVEFFDRPAAAAMAARLPENGFCVFPALLDETEELTDEANTWIDTASAPFGIIHGDPNNKRTGDLIESLGLLTSGFLVGGLTASRSAQPQVAGDVTGGGVSGVLFAPGVEVATGLTQGCLPVGPIHVVSDCLDNIIFGLDGKAALDVFKEDVGELLARDLKRAAGYIHTAFPIQGSDTGDYVVRNLVGVDPDRGWLAVGDNIQAGDRVMFVRRDPKSAEEDLTNMLEGLKKRLPGDPRGGVYFSCTARGPNMFGEEGKEMSIVRDILGDIPIVGFFGNGEVSNNRIYGYTGVLALFL